MWKFVVLNFRRVETDLDVLRDFQPDSGCSVTNTTAAMAIRAATLLRVTIHSTSFGTTVFVDSNHCASFKFRVIAHVLIENVYSTYHCILESKLAHDLYSELT